MSRCRSGPFVVNAFVVEMATKMKGVGWEEEKSEEKENKYTSGGS